MSGPDSTPGRAIDRVQPQRDRLSEAQAAFERASELPGASVATMRAALGELRAAFHAHVDFAEGPLGLFEEMQLDAPVESAAEMDRLRRDHITIHGIIDRIDVLLAADGAASDDKQVREGITELVRLINEHRRRGAELLYDVYDVDVGGSG